MPDFVIPMLPESTSTASGDSSAEASSHRRCPQCGSLRVYRSHRRGGCERVLRWMGLKIRRCHACGLRFTRYGGSVILIADVERTLRGLVQLAVALAGTLLVVAAMLWLTARQAAD